MPVFDPPPGWTDDRSGFGSGLDRERMARKISRGLPALGAAHQTSIVADLEHPTALCARLLAVATGRPLRSIRDYCRGSERERVGDLIYVLPLEQCDDDFLLNSLEGFSERLRTECALSRLPGATLVTARNLPALSRMVAKLIVDHRRPSEERAHFRHYAPKGLGAVVSDLWVGVRATPPDRSLLTGSGLLGAYGRHADVVGFHTHGSEACAKGGDGTVLCGLARSIRHGSEQVLPLVAPKPAGMLACGHGLACPRGPHPIAIGELGAKIIILGSCNGFRLADSLTHSDFNFALSFVDGPGLGFVSSVFTSIGGDIASTAFLAAFASGLSLGESTALINAFLHHGELEHPSFMAIGDYDMRVCGDRSAVEPSVDRLPARLEAGDTHFAQLSIHDRSLVQAARDGRCGFRVTRDDGSAAASGFCRVEKTDADAAPCLVLRVFSFPEMLGTVVIDHVDRRSLQETASDRLTALRYWLDHWRLARLDVELPEVFAELRMSEGDFRERLAREVALSSLNGVFVSRLEQSIVGVDEIVDIASASVVQHLVPLLSGGFWLSNLHRADRFLRSERTACLSCDGPALVRTLRNAIADHDRTVVICPRCGIAADIPDSAAISAVAIKLSDISIEAGRTLFVSIHVKSRNASAIEVHPRVSTHGEATPVPTPDHRAIMMADDGWSVFEFEFAIPEQMSPHRHYIKVLLVTTAGLSFASRPFFVTPAAKGPEATRVN